MFRCNKTKSELKRTNALKYISWGEEQSYHLRPSCANRNQWWTLPLQGSNNFIVMRFRDIRNWTPIIDDNQYEIGDSVFVGNYKKGYDVKTGNLILNSTYLIMISEIYGRKNLGDGLLTTYGPEIKPFLLVNPNALNLKDFDEERFYRRIVYNVFKECGIDPETEVSIEEQDPKPLPDRKELDDIVFDAIGLTEEERKDVYRAVCRLVWNRISKTKSVKKR